jgi:hypothetical protein
MEITKNFASSMFMPTHYLKYLRLFKVLGIPSTLDDTTYNVPAVAAVATQHWLSKHGAHLADSLPQYRDSQLMDTLPHLLKTHLFREGVHCLPRGCERVVYMGGNFDTMYRQFRTTLHQALLAKHIICVLDQAPGRYDEPLLVELTSAHNDKLRAHPWIQQQWSLGENAFATQYELGIAALLCKIPDAQVQEPSNDLVQYVQWHESCITLFNASAARRQSPVGYSALQRLMHHLPMQGGIHLAVASDGPRVIRNAVQAQRQITSLPDAQQVHVHSFGATGAERLITHTRDTAMHALAELAYLAQMAVEELQ